MSAIKWLIGGAAAFYLYNKISTALALIKFQVEVTGFKFHSVKLDYTTIDLDFLLANFSNTRVVLNNIQFSLFLNGSFAGYTNQPLGGVVLESYGQTVARCRVQLKTSKLLSLLTSYISTTGDKYRIDVRIDGRMGINSSSYAFTPSFFVRIPSLTSFVSLISNLFNSNDKTTDLAPGTESEIETGND